MKGKRLLLLALVLFLALTVLAFGRLRAFHRATEREQTAWESLAQRVEIPTPGALPEREPEDTEPSPFPINAGRFAPLIAENADFAAWLTIPGTVIDYPVMSPTDEPDFYLTHDFAKNESYSGTPFMAVGCDSKSDNILIHAHNMKNGTMFAPLLAYAEEEFFRAHPTVRFDTPESSGEYAVLAVFPEKLHAEGEENAFRYYDYAGTLTEERFAEYTEKCKAASLFESGVTAGYGEPLLTLSTCAYHTQDGRFVVVAVRKE